MNHRQALPASFDVRPVEIVSGPIAIAGPGQVLVRLTAATLTGAMGVACAVEKVGSTLPLTINAMALGGTVAVVGFLGGREVPLEVITLIGPVNRLQGVSTGTRRTLERVVRAIEAHAIRP